MRAQSLLGALCAASAFWTIDPEGAAGQGVYGHVGVGGGTATVRSGTTLVPAASLAFGVHGTRLANLRVEIRAIGDTDTAFLGASGAVGAAVPVNPAIHAYFLGAAGGGLFTEGEAAPHVGFLGGFGSRRLFGELRYDFVTASLSNSSRSPHMLSLVAGLRAGARPAPVAP